MQTYFNAIFIIFIIPLQLLQAQDQKEISGVVTDEQEAPLPGVHVVIEETNKGTQTDFDGRYSIETKKGQTLTYSYVGLKSKSASIEQDDEEINISLQESNELDEVVVTALGISREKKSLGYSSQKVQGSEVNKVNPANISNALSGKVAGLNITRNNNFGGSTNVVIRGKNSISGNNQALYVVDGVPIDNSNNNQTGQENAALLEYDYGSAIDDLNPDDIESVNVLKGAAASALYGSRAANGVIVIETKNGTAQEGFGVTFNSNIQVGSLDTKTFPEFQNQYGGGYAGQEFTYEDINKDGTDDLVANYIDDASYGPAFDPDLKVFQWDAFDPESPNYLKKTSWQPSKNGPKTFFETPVNIENSIAVQNKLDKGNYRFSYKNTDTKGNWPNQKIQRHNFHFKGDFDVNDWVDVSLNTNYIKTKGKGRNVTGGTDNPVSLFRQWGQSNVDYKLLETLYKKTGRNITWNPETSEPGAGSLYWDNPYWMAYENAEEDTRNRFRGIAQVNFHIVDWLNITGRISTDTYNERQEEHRAEGSRAANFGVDNNRVTSGYQRREIQHTETNYDLHLNFNPEINERVSLNALLGGNIRRNEFQDLIASTAGGLLVPGVYSLQNGKDAPPNPYEAEEKTGINAVFANASIGFDNLAFIEGSLRRDHFSTLPKKSSKSVVYYPSISGSFLFSELLESNNLSYGKFRANYAEVGNGAPFDKLHDNYIINSDVGVSSPKSSSNPNLKPERTKSFELGLEAKFFHNRLGFDFAVYNDLTKDQIIDLPVSSGTGYTSKLLNAGEVRNRGFELALHANPIELKDWHWSVIANFSKNKSKVLTLPAGINTIEIGGLGTATVQAKEGSPNGVIHGSDYIYDEGNKVIDEHGQYKQTTSMNHEIGDVNPDWLLGITNNISWKNLAFSFLIDLQKGGSVFSNDQYNGESTGLYPNSTFINDKGNPVRDPIDEGGGFIREGIKEDGTKNDIRVDASESGEFGYEAHPIAGFVYDASYIKLRELSLTYDFPKKLLNNTFINGLQCSFTGSNLWIIHKKLPYADPESGMSSGNVQGVLTAAMPTFKQYGFNLKAQF